MPPDSPLAPLATAGAEAIRPRTGPWFRDDSGAKMFWNGVTYGPLANHATVVRSDFARIAALGFNLVRVYELPDRAMLEACAEHGLRLLVGVPWTQHGDFLANRTLRREAIDRVGAAARSLAGEPRVAGLLIGNEVEKTLVRWMGPERVQRFLEELIAVAQREAPHLPVAYANYPSTEYLAPRNADFVAFNVFLEQRADFARYLAHLQVMAGGRPLVITEFGVDTRRHGAEVQAKIMAWEMEEARRAGIAGNFWFSFTDEWCRGGQDVTGWDFGLVTRERQPKPACALLPLTAPPPPGSEPMLLSVIVCTRNGAATLGECLAALERQTYPRFEVLVIDDGSTDGTATIARTFSFASYHPQPHAGLSAARNLGTQLARGEVVAFTDDDCAPDADWLSRLARCFDDPACVAAGGPNLPPNPRSSVESVVAAAPGAPAQVLAGDFEAEHLPGCNLALRKAALLAVGGFRVEFTAAGDDVDVCWRLQEAGGRLVFAPAAVVWHHRRATVGAYLRQQRGYGHAEAQLMRRWPERFAWFGGARWRGAIYGDAVPGDLSGKRIDFGPRGSALFPTVYAGHDQPRSRAWLGLAPALAALGCVLAGFFFPPAWLAGALVLAGSVAAAAIEAGRRRHDLLRDSLPNRILLIALCWLQPAVRDFARWHGMIALGVRPRARLGRVFPPPAAGEPGRFGRTEWEFPWPPGGETDGFLVALQSAGGAAGISCEPVRTLGSLWDLELGSMGVGAHVAAVVEYHERGARRLRVRCSRPRWARLPGWMPFLPLILGTCAALLVPGSGALRRVLVETALFLQFSVFAFSFAWHRSALGSFRRLIERAAQPGASPAGEVPLAGRPDPARVPDRAP